jgi:hypothetical protein
MHAKNGVAQRCENTLTRMQLCQREATWYEFVKIRYTIFTSEAASLRNRNNTTGDSKNLKVLAHLILDLFYLLKR